MVRAGEATAIRPAGPLDAAILAALQNAVFPDEPWRPREVAALLHQPGAIAYLAVGRASGEPVPQGYVMARMAADEAEVLSLAVLEAARRHGIASRLLAAALERAGLAGARRVYLEVARDNAAAIALYRAAGFARAGRRRGYYRRPGGRRVDALVLARDAPHA